MVRLRDGETESSNISPSHHLTISPSHHLTISPSHRLTELPSSCWRETRACGQAHEAHRDSDRSNDHRSADRFGRLDRADGSARSRRAWSIPEERGTVDG